MWRRIVDIFNLAYSRISFKTYQLLTLNSIIHFMYIYIFFRDYKHDSVLHAIYGNQPKIQKYQVKPVTLFSRPQSVIRQYINMILFFGVNMLILGIFDIFINFSSFLDYICLIYCVVPGAAYIYIYIQIYNNICNV